VADDKVGEGEIADLVATDEHIVLWLATRRGHRRRMIAWQKCFLLAGAAPLGGDAGTD
jgi:hypothetical protein